MNEYNNNIIYYNKLLELQKQYEEGIITEDDMILDEINNLIKLYKSQINSIRNNIRVRTLYKKIGDR